jgi:predicted  nucleic acid-binding Zn-ribbon protein
MTEHEQDADRLERELDDMQHQSERLEGEISEARSDWETKQRDASVPGAVDSREPEGPAEPDPEQQQRADEDD